MPPALAEALLRVNRAPAAGIPTHEVSRGLGHKSITTPVDICGYLVPESWGLCQRRRANPPGRCGWRAAALG